MSENKVTDEENQLIRMGAATNWTISSKILGPFYFPTPMFEGAWSEIMLYPNTCQVFGMSIVMLLLPMEL